MFTPEQVKELENNKNVIKCSSKSISYSNQFKLAAVKKYYQEGGSPSMIFREAGFSSNYLSNIKAKACLGRWRRKYNSEGKDSLLKDGRGGPGRRTAQVKYKDNDEKIEYLETKIAYLEAENDFLAKLRGLKRE